MPSPNKGEQRKDFISRCMSSQEAINTFSDSRQRAAFCYGQWKKETKGTTKLSESIHQIKKDPLLEKPPVEQVKKRKKKG